MNILISHHWLKEYLETQVEPKRIAESLSLCGASVENLEKKGTDWLYNIEVTTNRVDMMSVAGTARELAIILPQFGLKAELKKDPYTQTLSLNKVLKNGLPLALTITKKGICLRSTLVVLDNISVKSSSDFIKQRLEKTGIRPLNNVVDISNYLMKEYGQPIHMFDYDKICKHTLTMRLSHRGEKLTTLDKKEHKLPGNDIVIEDGAKRLIDLCGIMGGNNSAIDETTKRVVLFVQTYDASYIRKTAMTLAHRSEAAQLFEKKTDPELVRPTFLAGIKLLQKYAGGKIASTIIDLYPKPVKPKKISTTLLFIEKRLGIKLSLIKVEQILSGLGFKVNLNTKKRSLEVLVPSWRVNDVCLAEDLVEEVARIYGYHNLPSNLPSGPLPKIYHEPTFYWEKQIKQSLKNWGYTETYTFSLQSKALIAKFKLETKDHLKLKNPLSSDWVYLRTSLLPSLLELVHQNRKYEDVNFFELSKVYLPQQKGLPYEVQRLDIVSTKDFYHIKGVAETIFQEMNIKAIFQPHQRITQLEPGKTAIIKDKKNGLILGFIGQVFKPILTLFAIDKEIVIADLNFDKLVDLAKKTKKYQPLPKYPPIIEKLTFINQSRVLASEIVDIVEKAHRLVKSVEVSDIYKNRISLQIIYQSWQRSLKDKEINAIRKIMVRKLEKLGLELHGQLR